MQNCKSIVAMVSCIVHRYGLHYNEMMTVLQEL